MANQGWSSLPIATENLHQVLAVTNVLKISDDTIRRVMVIMDNEMKLGMSRHDNQRRQSSLQMENTYVRFLLDGTEEGRYMALDLGGTNFRIILIEMKAGKIVNETFNLFTIPEAVLCGNSNQVFDYLADSIEVFLTDNQLLDENIPLGFTFSFPMEQKSLDSGYLVTWTKSFRVTGGVGEDAVQNLKDAIQRRGGFSVNIVAILNDTTGTLMAGSYLDHQCQIGMILGTGSNASYVENLENIDKWTDPIDDPKQVLIDLEWGAFGDNGVLDFMKSEYDFEVNKKSNHVNSFTFEKLFSGMYMGEVVRLILLKLIKERLMFKGQTTDKITKDWQFTTKCISDIMADTENDSRQTRHVIEEFDLGHVTSDDDVAIVKYLCYLVSVRAAKLIAAGLAVLITHIKKEQMTIAVDGSMYEHHPTLAKMIKDELHMLCPNTQAKFILAKDGSGRGAAFVAAVACKQSQLTHTNVYKQS